MKLCFYIAKKLCCKVEEIGPTKVYVANGGSLKCVAICKGLTWTLQGTKFVTDVLLLSLGSCDMVLGVQWLETLGEIKWDFKQLRMEFMVQGKRHVLRGCSEATTLKTISGKQMNKIFLNPGNFSAIQLCSLHLKHEIKTKNDKVPEEIKELLFSYEEIFREPTSLPPARAHDHKIPLKEGVSTINVRPYRHSTMQKDMVELMTKELLDTGLVQPSNNPFSSPIVLVKKKDGSWRMCIDYRELNKSIVKEKYPIPVI